jgi:O-acetylhomoserine (thiol)-lyase
MREFPMKIVINGNQKDIGGDLTLRDLLILLNVESPDLVSVELNGVILNRGEISTVKVQENDTIEFLYFLGGGTTSPNPLGFTTRAIHESRTGKDPNHSLRFPIYATVSHDFETAETMADSFSGRRGGYAYSRIANPTVDAFERTITALEEGIATVAVSSGMAAISTTLFNLVLTGDNIVAASSLFGGTYSLMRNVVRPLGVEIRFVPADDTAAIEAAIDGRTRAVFLETISNPCSIVPDFGKISEVTSRHHVVLIADSTVTTPYLFHAKQFGVNVVIHSTTKYISGGATGMGGAIVDLGNFDWSYIPSLSEYHRFRDMAFIARLKKEVYREIGSCQSPHDAYLQSLGLETLALRMEKTCRNALEIAEFLEGQDAVSSVLYPGLPNSPFHEQAKSQFNGLYGGVLAFRLANESACFRFLNRLNLVRRSSNIGDNKTLALHAASTIFAVCTDEERKALGVDGALIRLSVGIEDIEDVLADIRQALDRI